MNYVFVYGTLMSGQPNNEVLGSSRLLGRYVTHHLKLVLIDGNFTFPAMVPGENGDQVFGEVWAASSKTLYDLDVLESVYSGLYAQRCIDVWPIEKKNIYSRGSWATGRPRKLGSFTAITYMPTSVSLTRIEQLKCPTIEGGDWLAYLQSQLPTSVRA